MQELDFSEAASLDRLFTGEEEEPVSVPLGINYWKQEDEYFLSMLSSRGYVKTL